MDSGLTVLLIAVPVLMALAAVGGVLAIKLGRRRQPSHGQVGEAVPARPLEPGQSRRLARNYFAVLAVAVVVLGGFAVAQWLGGGA